MQRLEVAVCHVRRKLHVARRVVLELVPSRGFNDNGRNVFPADAHLLAQLVQLLFRIDARCQHRLQGILEFLESFRQLALGEGLVARLDLVRQLRHRHAHRRQPVGSSRGPHVVFVVAMHGTLHQGRSGRPVQQRLRASVDSQEDGLERSEVDDAALPVEQIHRGRECAGSNVLSRHARVLLPSQDRGRPHGGGGEETPARARALVRCSSAAKVSKVKVVDVPARASALTPAKLGIEVIPTPPVAACIVSRSVSSILLCLAVAEVEVVASPSPANVGVQLLHLLRVAPLRVHGAVEVALGHAKERPVVFAEDRGGGEEERGARLGGAGGTLLLRDRGLDFGSKVREAVGAGGEEGESRLVLLAEDLDAFLHVAEVEGVVEAAHDVAAHLGDAQHLRQLLRVAGEQVEEGQPLKVFRLLVRHLDDLVVPLPQRLDAELVPAVLVLERGRRGERDLDVAALDGEVEARFLVLDKLESHLGEALLLEVPDNGLPAQLRLLDDAQHLVVLAVDERRLELELRLVNRERLGVALAIEAEELVAGRLAQVHRGVERADDTVVALRDAELDVVQGCVDEGPRATLLPHPTLDADRLVHSRQVLELLRVAPHQHHRVLAQQRKVLHVARPHHVLDIRACDLPHRALLLQVEQRDLVLGLAQQHPRPCVEDQVRVGVRGR
mmetsp:Transcript_51841/g.105519  ORF Transcript_51841/g.105519 Transcript_51841/m.105519 type:complete len:671 (+) Transcript_51841:722-2734(+)